MSKIHTTYRVIIDILNLSIMVTKINLDKLVDTLKHNIALQFLIDLDEVFGFEVGNLTPEQVAHKTIDNCIYNAIQDFEFYCPLYLDMKIHFDNRTGNYEFIDNFRQYLDGIVAEDQIILVPSAVVNIHPIGQLYSMSGTRIGWYDPARRLLSMNGVTGWFNTGTMAAYCICARPFIHEYNDFGKYSEKSGYYFFDESDSLWSTFLKYCTMHILLRIMELKNNLTLPGFPVEMFGSVEEIYRDLKSELQEWGQANITRGELVL